MVIQVCENEITLCDDQSNIITIVDFYLTAVKCEHDLNISLI